MPRHNRRRVVDAMSDHIEEEDDASQRPEVDAVDADEGDEEDQQPRPPRRTLNRSAQGGSSRSVAAAAAAARDATEAEAEQDDDPAQDATPVFDEDSFGNKPLSRYDAQKLQGMASDWNMIETNLKESAFSLLTEVSTAVAEYADDSTVEKVRSLLAPSSVPARSRRTSGTKEAGCSHEGYHRYRRGDSGS